MTAEDAAQMIYELHAAATLLAEVHRLFHFVAGFAGAMVIFRLCGFGNSAYLLNRGSAP